MVLPISVVICTYNRVDSLRRCVDALFSVETDNDWELVIVDNGSNDGTADFLASLPRQFRRAQIIITNETKRGRGTALNRGWRVAQGNIVAFTDDDCYVFKNFIDATISAFNKKANIGFIGGRILLYDKSDLRLTIQESEEYLSIEPRSFITAGLVQGANMAFRRETLERIGGFDEYLYSGADIEAVAAASWAGIAGAYDPEPTVYHHHGRKTQHDAWNLGLRYDRGRGGYYLKFVIFNREARYTYAKAWFHSAKAELRSAFRNALRGRRPAVRRSLRELYGGFQYLWSRYK